MRVGASRLTAEKRQAGDRGPTRTLRLSRGHALCLRRSRGAGTVQGAAGQRGGCVPLGPRGPVSALQGLCSLGGEGPWQGRGFTRRRGRGASGQAGGRRSLYPLEDRR